MVVVNDCCCEWGKYYVNLVGEDEEEKDDKYVGWEIILSM